MRCGLRPLAFLIFIFCVPQITLGEDCPRNLTRVSRGTNGGFSLVELLVVIGTVGVLVGLSLPALSKARSAARDVKCLSNLRQSLVATQVYANDYRVLPVHNINNEGASPTASVDLRRALEITEGTFKAWQCPEDKGFEVLQNGETSFHSYLYLGLSAMASQQPPIIFDPRNAERRYEREQTRELFYRLPVYMDVYGFHNSRTGRPYYLDGERNSAWWDGTVRRFPKNPSGPPPRP